MSLTGRTIGTMSSLVNGVFLDVVVGEIKMAQTAIIFISWALGFLLSNNNEGS